MINSEFFINGFTFNQGNDGIKPTDMVGYGIGGPLNIAVIFVSITCDSSQVGKVYSVLGLPPAPGFGNSDTITVFDLSVSATCTYTRVASTTQGVERYAFSGGFTTQDLPDGFWGTLLRAQIPAAPEDETHITREIYVQAQSYEIADLPNSTLLGTISDPTIEEGPNFEEEGEVIFSWTISNPSNTLRPDDGFWIERFETGEGNWRGVATKPRRLDNNPNYSFTENLSDSGSTETGAGTYKYRVRVYNLPTLDKGPVSDPTPEITWNTDPPPIPDINVTGTGGIAFGGAASLFLIGNPSGIYTFTEGKTHDTLYERGAVTSVNVAIPDPYIRTAFIGHDGQTINHYGLIRTRVQGSGNLKFTLMSLRDEAGNPVKTKELIDLVMSTATQKLLTKLANFNQMGAQLELKTVEMNERFDITSIAIYISPVATSYPG